MLYKYNDAALPPSLTRGLVILVLMMLVGGMMVDNTVTNILFEGHLHICVCYDDENDLTGAAPVAAAALINRLDSFFSSF